MVSIAWDEHVLEDLEAMGEAQAQRVLNMVSSYKMENPMEGSKPLKDDTCGLYRYCIGGLKFIYEIRQDERQIVMVRVGREKQGARNAEVV